MEETLIIQGARKHLTELFDLKSIPKLVRGITIAVGQSFQTDKMLNPTRDEVRRRFDICMKWAETLRGDLSWNVERIADTCPEILKTELSGVRWEPHKRESWIVTE